MAKSRLRLDKRRPLKDGTYPVQIAVGYGTNVYLSTGIYIMADEWDATTCRVTGQHARRLNAVLAALLTRVVNRILDLRETGSWDTYTSAQVREMLVNMDLDAPTVGAPSLGAMFDMVIQSKAPRTRTLFQQTFKKISAYCEPYTTKLEDITKFWLDGFDASMQKASLSVNTRGQHLKCLRNVMNYASSEGYTHNYPFRTYHIKTEDTAVNVLTPSKMRQLANMQLNAEESIWRDIFMLTFYLIGINAVDLAALTSDSIVNGRIEYRRAKTGKHYSIKIEPEAADIIKRYRGKHHLLKFFDGTDDYIPIYNKINYHLKRLGAPDIFEKHLTLYWARYSWATYAASIDIQKDTISEALGHAYGCSVTGVYIKFSQDKIDEANRRVIDYALYDE